MLRLDLGLIQGVDMASEYCVGLGSRFGSEAE